MVLLMLIAICQIPVTEAQANHGLAWGIEAPYSYEMDMLIQTNESSTQDWFNCFNETIQLNFTNTPSIPSTINEWDDVISPTVAISLLNGSTPAELSVFDEVLDVIVPIGNFTMLTTLAEDLDTPEVYLSDFYQWGCRYTVVPHPQRWDIDLTFYKRTGLLVDYSINAWNVTTGEHLGNISIVCDREPPQVERVTVVGGSIQIPGWRTMDANPGAYEVFLVNSPLDRTLLNSGYCNESEWFIHPDLSGLGLGSHEIMIVVYDASGLWTSDTISYTKEPSPLLILLVSAGGIGVVAVVIAAYWFQFRKPR